MVRRFVDERILPEVAELDREDEFPEEIVAQMRELGLFGVTIPEAYGGMGLDLTTYAMIIEELARGWISSPASSTRTSWAPTCCCASAPRSSASACCRAMATGERRAAFSLSEPGLGSDVAAITTRASTLDDGAWEIDGTKMWVTNGLRSSLVFVLVRTDPEATPRHRGLTVLHRREGAGRRENPARGRACRSRRRSTSWATAASSRPSSSSTATAARPRTSWAARRPASAAASRR